MNVEVMPFELVFDRRVNFAPRAILDLGRAPFPRALMRRHAIQEHDGLDAFEVVPLALIRDDGGRRHFALWRHAGNPPDQAAIHLPLGTAAAPDLQDIMAAMSVPAAAILWLDESAGSRLLSRAG
jgi:hypothetical protein